MKNYYIKLNSRKDYSDWFKIINKDGRCDYHEINERHENYANVYYVHAHKEGKSFAAYVFINPRPGINYISFDEWQLIRNMEI